MIHSNNNQNEALIWEYLFKNHSAEPFFCGKSQQPSPASGDRVLVKLDGNKITGTVRLFGPKNEPGLNGFVQSKVYFGNQESLIADKVKRDLEQLGISPIDVAGECFVSLDHSGRQICHAVTSRPAKWFPRFEAIILQPNMLNSLSDKAIKVAYGGKTTATFTQTRNGLKLTIGQQVVGDKPADMLFQSILDTNLLKRMFGSHIPNSEVFALRVGTLERALKELCGQKRAEHIRMYLTEAIFPQHSIESQVEETDDFEY